MRQHGLQARLTFDQFERTEAEVAQIFGGSERHGKNPAKYRLWSKTLGEWVPDGDPDFTAVGEQAAQLSRQADAVGLGGRRFITFSIRGASAHGELQIPGDFISLAAEVGLEILVSLWNDNPGEDDEGERRKVTASTRGEVLFSTDDVMAELPTGVFSALHGSDVATIDIAHDDMHADIRLVADAVRELRSAKASVVVSFRHIDYLTVSS